MQNKRFEIPECWATTLTKPSDVRGDFIKPFDLSRLKNEGLDFKVSETFMSFSKKSVVRGLHFQTPPFDHAKLIYCSHGKILDVFVDLRVGSPTYKKSGSLVLSAAEPTLLHLPSGLAHGFLALEDDTEVIYWVNSGYSAEHDSGILWNSIEFNWPVDAPILSTRDSKFVALKDFDSPFRY